MTKPKADRNALQDRNSGCRRYASPRIGISDQILRAVCLPESPRSNNVGIPSAKLVLGVPMRSSDGCAGARKPVRWCIAPPLVRVRGTGAALRGGPRILWCRACSRSTKRRRPRPAAGSTSWSTGNKVISSNSAAAWTKPQHRQSERPSLGYHDQSLGAIVKAGTTRIEDCIDYAETLGSPVFNLLPGPGLTTIRITSRPCLVRGGLSWLYDRNGEKKRQSANAIAPGHQLASNNRVFDRMSLTTSDISAVT